jgi:hypothetical protein
MKLGFFSLLTLILVVFKLLGTLTASWWVVFSPLFVGFILLVLFAAIAVGVLEN